MAQELGYTSISSQALDVMNDVVKQCKSKADVSQLSQKSKLASEHLGRSEVNLLDVMQHLGDDEEVLGMLKQNGGQLEFSRENVEFPVPQQSFPQEDQKIENEYNIPNFLPNFPPSHTYLYTPVYIHHNEDPNIVRQIKSNQKREIEERLTEIMQEPPLEMDIDYVNPETSNPYLQLNN